MYEILIALMLLSAGDYQSRVKAEHKLKVSGISFEYGKAFYDASECPEFRHRMMRVLWVVWCVENAEKYEPNDNYYNSQEIMEDLKKYDFQEMFKKVYSSPC